MTGAAVNIVPMATHLAPNTSARRPERIGHRGAPRELPENTQPSFARAVERGADAVELDVHATADGVCVVHHDPVIGHAVDGKYLGRAIAAMSWRDVERVELAPGIFLPSLEQVLRRLAGRAMVYVEIKGAGIEEIVASTIAGSNAKCAVHSFDHAAISRMARIAPNVPRGILFDEPPRDVTRSMRDVGARDVWAQWELVDEALVDAVHAAGGRVLPWTVNAVDVAERLAALGIDGICSDDLRMFDHSSPMYS
jgi:glycerophosphoryl diester phosphodiesterase